MLSFFECITGSSAMSLEDIKLIANFNWIFHISDFLILFMISFKYVLILSKCFSIDSVLTLLSLLLSSMQLLL